MERLRFAVVISHPIQHYSPVFRELAKIPELDVRVFYCCDWGVKPAFDPGFGREVAWDVPLLEGYSHEFLPIRKSPTRQTFLEVDNPALPARLDAFAPHAMWVHGYGHRSCWRAVRWARGRCAVIHFGDSELIHHRSWARRAAKKLVVSWFFRRCDAVLTLGDNNEAYYRHYGVPARKMFRAACPVDVGRFESAITAPGRPDRASIRRRFGLPEEGVVVLFSAKMMPIKRPFDLVEAMILLREAGTPIWALFVGDGELRPALERRVNEAGVAEFVRFTGFINQREIPLVVECADLVAVTSEQDAHPLAVTESLIMGQPIVASSRVGCVGPTDTARPGFNALVYPCGDVPALADSLRQLVDDPDLRRRMGQASRQLAAGQDIPVVVNAVLRALGELKVEFSESWRELSPAVHDRLASRAIDAAGR